MIERKIAITLGLLLGLYLIAVPIVGSWQVLPLVLPRLAVKQPEEPLKMLFVGDIMLDRNVKTIIETKGVDYILGDLTQAGFFVGYDLIGANLEGAVTNQGEHYAPVKEFDFAFSVDTVAELKKHGFTFFNLANNHFNDQGEQGIVQTRENLAAIGMAFSGCKDGVVDDCSATILNSKNKKIGLVGFSTVGASIDRQKAVAVVESLKSKVDFVIVNIHWGEEYITKSNDVQQGIAHLLIDAGADAIIGHHPHVVQEVEVYRGKPIFYSLGNFIFDQTFSAETQKGLAATLVFSAQGVAYELQPVESSKGKLFLSDR